VHLLLDALALQADILAAYVERIYEEAFLETAGRSNALRPDVAYALRTLEDGTLVIEFGDGERGRRLPSGNGSLTVTYRHGAGDAGEITVRTPARRRSSKRG
jgi:hypothetical protein